MPDEENALEPQTGPEEAPDEGPDESFWESEPAADAGISDTAADASREPEGDEPGTVGESQSSDAEETSETNPWDGWTSEDIDALLRQMPEELRKGSKEFAELQRRAEQSAADRLARQQEEMQRRQEMHALVLASGEKAAERLQRTYESVATLRERLNEALQDGDLDAVQKATRELESAVLSEDFWQDVQAYSSASRLYGSRAQIEAFQQAAKKYEGLVGEPTEEELALVREWQEHDIKHGTSATMGLMLDHLVAKAYKKGRDDEQAAMRQKAADEERLKAKDEQQLSRLERLRQFKREGRELRPPARAVSKPSFSLETGGEPDDDFWKAAEQELQTVKNLRRG
jgi:hypothetical protein